MIRSLSNEQRAFVESIRDFAARECARAQRDRLTAHGAEPHNQALYERVAELGWLGVVVPERYGGSGGGAVDMCLLCEEIMRGMIPIHYFAVSFITAGAVRRFGSEQLKREILGGIARGRVEAIAMTEPGAGSDVGSVSCLAQLIDGHYVINGQKTWITAAHAADHILLVCRTGTGTGSVTAAGGKHSGLSMISVPAGADGVEIRGIETMAGREVNDIFFTDCRVGAERLVGEQDGGWGQLMAGLNNERLIIAAQALGIAQRAFDDALAYVRERRQFGRPVGSFQALSHRLAELATELEATRLLIYDTAARVDADPSAVLRREASMCKLKAAELAKRATLEGMQMLGGAGYAAEYDMEHLLRVALVMPIYGGTSEIQREIIARTFGL
jgi:alkylation response protein AidB-like acyl-CoA dehydrogenase